MPPEVKVKEKGPTFHLLSISAMSMMTSGLLTWQLCQNLFIENICLVERGNSEEDCRQIVASLNATVFKDEEKEIQQIVAFHKTYRSIIDNTFPVLFVVFLGPWSDHYGRRVPLLLTTAGGFLSAVVAGVCSIHKATMNPYVLNILTAIPRTLTGGEVTFMMAAYAYISDHTDHRYRTVRTGLMNAGFQLGIPLGFALSGTFLDHGLGYASGFFASGIISLLSMWIVWVATRNRPNKGREQQELSGTSDENGHSCWDIVNPKNNFFAVAKLPFKRRENNGRIKLWLLLIIFICAAAPIYGEFAVMYLFVRDRLSWSGVDFGKFSSYNWFIGVVGVGLSMGILSKWLRLRDPIVGFLAGLSQLGGCVLYLLASSGVMLYLASTVDMMNGTMVVIARSMMSKVVGADEVGTLFSFIAVLESVIPLGMNPIYSTLYHFTVRDFSGWVFVLSAIMTLPPQIIYLWFIWKRKQNRTSETRTLEDEKLDLVASSIPMTMTIKIDEKDADVHRKISDDNLF